jgi:hypothetical protein
MRIPQEIMARQMFIAFPELEKHADQMHFIDATINQREVFLTRDTISIVEEITDGRFRVLYGNFMVKEPDESSAMKIHQDWTYVDETLYNSFAFIK